jgi:hypothetical protein
LIEKYKWEVLPDPSGELPLASRVECPDLGCQTGGNCQNPVP